MNETKKQKAKSQTPQQLKKKKATIISTSPLNHQSCKIQTYPDNHTSSIQHQEQKNKHPKTKCVKKLRNHLMKGAHRFSLYGSLPH